MAISDTGTRPYVGTRETAAPVRRAYQLLHVAFIAIPVIAGLDKFAMILADWHAYLAPVFRNVLPFDPHYFMYAVGVIEVLAALIVALRPRIGGYIVAAWLAAISVNLMVGGYWDIALRDIGLAGAALALAWLSPRTRNVT